jgi:hypothetical protein
MKANPKKTILILISCLLFLLSLPMPIFPGWPGYGILFFGFFGMLTFEPANLTWLANPLLLGGWIAVLASNRRWATYFTVSAVVVAGSFVFCKSVLTSESGTPTMIGKLPLGYWLWFSSMIAAAASAYFTEKRR